MRPQNVFKGTIILIAVGTAGWWMLQKSNQQTQRFSGSERVVASVITPSATSLVTKSDTQQNQDTIRTIDIELFKYGFQPDPLILIAGETVRLRFSTRDVPHSFSMGDEGFEKWNFPVEPGAPVEKELIVPNLPGEYVVACDVFCGKGHQGMHGIVRVMPAR